MTRKQMWLGRAITRQRKRMGLSLRALARRMGVSPSALCRWENGSRVPGEEMLGRIIVALAWDPEAVRLAREAFGDVVEVGK